MYIQFDTHWDSPNTADHLQCMPFGSHTSQDHMSRWIHRMNVAQTYFIWDQGQVEDWSESSEAGGAGESGG